MEFIVGTVLAGVPIVLEAYDHYERLSQGCSTFRHYSRELAKLDTVMKIQRTLFRANIIKLLTVLTNDPTARDLLAQDAPTQWDGLNIPVPCGQDRNRLEALGEMFDSWEATLDLVLQSIEAICLELESFRVDSTETLKQLSRRFRLSWKKSETEDAIKELRDFTADFNELTARIIVELKEVKSSPPATSAMRWRASQLNSLENYRQIREASNRLYNSFARRWSCTKHQRHAANICVVSGKPQQDLCVKFGIAIDSEQVESKCLDSEHVEPKCRETPIWFEVEALDAENAFIPAPQKCDIALDNAMEKIETHSKPLSIRPATKKSKKKSKNKKVRIRSSSTSTGSVPGLSTGPPTVCPKTPASSNSTLISTPSITTVDLSLVNDFCNHFQVTQIDTNNPCVGYLKDDGLHRFYLPALQQPEQQMSLQEIIAWVSEDAVFRTIPRRTIVNLAHSLSAAMLQYHSTPWLSNTWQSGTVRFFGIKELSDNVGEITSKVPYFRVEMPKADGSVPAPTDETSSLARNELLFQLGTVLLELAYCQPWSRLLQRTLSTLPDARQTGYHIAEKLARAHLLRDRMGPKFSTIVRKCLGCDFGLGESDLANEQLQGVFLVDVVGELQEVERGLKELEVRLG